MTPEHLLTFDKMRKPEAYSVERADEIRENIASQIQSTGDTTSEPPVGGCSCKGYDSTGCILHDTGAPVSSSTPRRVWCDHKPECNSIAEHEQRAPEVTETPPSAGAGLIVIYLRALSQGNQPLDSGNLLTAANCIEAADNAIEFAEAQLTGIAGCYPEDDRRLKAALLALAAAHPAQSDTETRR